MDIENGNAYSMDMPFSLSISLTLFPLSPLIDPSILGGKKVELMHLENGIGNSMEMPFNMKSIHHFPLFLSE